MDIVTASRNSLRRLVGVAAVGVGAAVAITAVPAGAGSTQVDPTTLTRGADPSVVHMVRNTIRDGDLRVPATTKGEHEALWVVRGGYLVRDYNVGPRSAIRVVLISKSGDRRVIARSRDWIDVETSPSGRRFAVQRTADFESLRSVVTVHRSLTGRVTARRELRLVTLTAVTDHRVLLGRRARWHDPATVWWNYDQDTLRRIHDQAALSADVAHDRVVFDRPRDGEFCNRVAVLSHPEQTLWRSCQVRPHQWSPDGSHLLATHTYFDAAGTDRWWIRDGLTDEYLSRITGRLDWEAVWEDDQHFLTMAQSETGKAAIVRCDLSVTCERASRNWDVPLPSEPSLYYDSPPVVLADR